MSSEHAVGIDLGTTFSVVAHLDTNGRPWTILNAEGDVTTSSVVFFEPNAAIVGKEAVKMAEYEPEMIAQFAKRDMGHEKYRKTIRDEHLPPEVIQAIILQKLKHDAELKLGELTKAVITVPAYFNDARRKATQDAGRLAGLDVLDIINEPTAAAIAFGVQQGFLKPDGATHATERVLVYDLGGGTFDATLMEIEGKNYRVLSTAGDVYLGGIDWDKRLADELAERFIDEYDVDPREDVLGMQMLLREAEDAKRSLSARDSVPVRMNFQGKRLKVDLTREEFQTVTDDLLDRTRFTIRKALREANLEWNDLTRLLLVGGSSRMPMVHEMLERESGLTVDRSLSPDEAVAHGAAVYAGLLMNQGDRLNMVVQDVNSHDLGILAIERETGRKRRKLMIPRNSPLPAKSVANFRTHRDNQTNVVADVIEGGDASGSNATPIGRVKVDGLPAGLPAKTPVRVELNYDEAGRLVVKAWLPSIGKEASLTIERESTMSEDDLNKWTHRLQNGLFTPQDETSAIDELQEVADDDVVDVSSVSDDVVPVDDLEEVDDVVAVDEVADDIVEVEDIVEDLQDMEDDDVVAVDDDDEIVPIDELEEVDDDVVPIDEFLDDDDVVAIDDVMDDEIVPIDEVNEV